MGWALKRVETNRRAPGTDNMPVTQLRQHLKEHWPRIKEDLLDGRYQPAPVLRGWLNYFRLAEAKGVFKELDGWIRRPLRFKA
ncbi:MAG: group II intron maturase-specific domain-containing protein [Thermoleophilia bacterium]